MTSKFIHFNTLFLAAIALFLAFGFTACSSTLSSDNSGVEVSEPEVEVSTSESQAVAESAAPRVEDLPVPPEQNNVELQAAAPEQYVVQEGDTLWDLSNRFLVEPWYWPEIWYLNPQINNPHLIYPGDVINVFYVGGKPYITVGGGPRVDGGPQFVGAERLSPKVRTEDIDADAFHVPIQAIQQFIIRPRVLSDEILNTSPYILGSQEERLVYGSGDRVYVRGFQEEPVGRYTVFRQGEEYHHPESNELLGYEAILVGDGEVVRTGDPVTFDLLQTKREALRGDRLLPINFSEQDTEFVPHAPAEGTQGYVIGLFDAISHVGSLQVVTISLGDRDGIEKGHVLAVNQAGRVIGDPFENPNTLVDVELPEEKTGIAMVFRTFEKVSYALVMETNDTIQLGDTVVTP